MIKFGRPLIFVMVKVFFYLKLLLKGIKTIETARVKNFPSPSPLFTASHWLLTPHSFIIIATIGEENRCPSSFLITDVYVLSLSFLLPSDKCTHVGFFFIFKHKYYHHYHHHHQYLLCYICRF